ncbi:Uncharacterised protein [Legionella feeleii]|uniref:Uncharacterized protein n=1 Tax=Legionella feeleii TaxID=453 RepID=A0A378ISJ6_9GAMM|nr:Uncharacterised protein [Legionella feeleii]
MKPQCLFPRDIILNLQIHFLSCKFFPAIKNPPIGGFLNGGKGLHHAHAAHTAHAAHITGTSHTFIFLRQVSNHALSGQH